MLNPSKQLANLILTNIGLVNTTSERQLKNGTLQFSDPKNKPVKYTLHANGYYRKYIPGGYFSPGGLASYQLNRTKRTPSRWGGFSTERILIPGEYVVMAKRIVKHVERSRKNS